MFSARPEGYKGKQFEHGFTEFFITGSFYGVVSFEDGTTQEDGKKSLEFFKEGLLSAKIENLASFEHAVSDLILKLNFPAHVDLAVGMLYKEALYVKTVGAGQVYFRRGNACNKLLSGDKTASGYLNQFDLAIFTTNKIEDLIGKAEDIQAFIAVEKPSGILQKLNDQEYGEEDIGFSALFVEFGQTEDSTSLVPSSDVSKAPTFEKPQKSSGVMPPTIVQVPGTNPPVRPTVAQNAPQEDIQPPQESFGSTSVLSKIIGFMRTKQFTIVAAVFILALLTWSVVFGYQRREAAKIQDRIESVTTEVDAKLSEAEDEAFLNLDQSMVLLGEAKTIVSQLKRDLGDNYKNEVTNLESKIQDSEGKIVKKESKDFEEFYDLTLENKDAKGSMIAKEDELVAILDGDQSTIYVLDVDSKSLTKYVNANVGSAKAIGIYRGDVFFATQEKGIFKFTTQRKVNNIVEEDGLKNIVDMELYNGNIYVVDEAADEIYKFLVTESGYSNKQSYFGSGQTIDLTDTTGMSIDGSVYISTTDSVQKYLSGVREQFSPEFPSEKTEFDDIYTDRDTEQLFVLDKKNAAVYILTKEGEYQRQIQSSVFAKADAMFVYDNKIFTLNNEKIYTVSLD